MTDKTDHSDVLQPELEYENVGWRNRIVGYAEVDPRSLLANEDNWRTHPFYQREVVGTALEEIGWVQDVIVNVRKHEDWSDKERGIETVLDGHLRVLLALQTDQPAVPVKYVDLTPEEEQAVLLVLDTSTGLATADKGRLKALLEQVKPMSDATKQLLIDIADKHKIVFDEESTLTSDDEFGDFSEYGAEGQDQDGSFVDFKFGDHSAKIRKSTYDLFVEQVNISKAETGEVMLDNVIHGWFERTPITPLEQQSLLGVETKQEYGKAPYDVDKDENEDEGEGEDLIKLP